MKMPLTGVIAALNEADVDYVTVGGLAVIAHGFPRATVDVDVIVPFDRPNVHKLVSCLRGIGFKPKMPIDPEKLSDPAERSAWQARNMIALALYDDQPPWTIIDIFIHHPIDYDSLRKNSIVIVVQGTPIRVCSLPHLIELKEQAGRVKDVEDLRWLYAILDGREKPDEQA